MFRVTSEIKTLNLNFKLKLNNELYSFYINQNLSIQNKLSLSNQYNYYYFNNKNTLDHNSFKSTAIISSDLQFDNIGKIYPKVKLIIPTQLENSNKNINEDSNSITFNYQNQFSENRFFGNDLFDSSPRIVFGLENYYNLNSKKNRYHLM